MHMNKLHFMDLIDIFGKQEVSDIFQQKALDLSSDSHPRFTPAQREYIIQRLGNHNGLRAIELADERKSNKRTTEIAYWCKQYLRLNPETTTFTNSLSTDQIQKAREYPTHELYNGRLIRSGRNFKSKCPFHDEKSPSFYFYNDNEKCSFHCYGCGAHGNNAIDYVMKLEKLDFATAVRRLI